ncbi:uncharacterized protein DUF4376 [Paracidovorax citrulli]|uniref:DUF4376 domain-containing protein n=2 Tax=Paracidovorax citrulli TaxID=80869 RepID=A1TMX5_PARC0|nr:hypothetical protein Aave_1726 [Paracidovorax citrulli AAC00-1]ATG94672.1 DUF4376 domain-containing protein [Paracidovorax citrulli]PVY66517.1 uncharacterized protein DUF4376 [Paracidovorax citrulli]REG69313.1 uncharacterized protein DUF4376 [Paracidovorax citrulli]RLJ93868.1 uncharacterized protein DUF4376 [Paracidovorax citrulli]
MSIYQLTRENIVYRWDDGVRSTIPTSDSPMAPNTNPDYIAYMAWIAAGGVPEPADPVPATEVWERIKAERDRRKYLGVKIGENWFHSDDASRIQQMSLMLMGQAMPAGIQWKTLTSAPPPVFVTMTPALALSIFNATAASDMAVFAAAEAHRVAMEASADPGAYDFTGGWPVSVEDELHTVHRD